MGQAVKPIAGLAGSIKEQKKRLSVTCIGQSYRGIWIICRCSPEFFVG